ncbi:MAG: AAA family ATPase [Saprospiraceae bacterium]|nr:AAA family ATPase [Saprospiraceae bacterium]
MAAKEQSDHLSDDEAYQFTPKEVESMLDGYINKTELNLSTVNSLSEPLFEQLSDNLSLVHLYNDKKQFFVNKGLKYKNVVKSSGNSIRKTVKRFYQKKLKPIIEEVILNTEDKSNKSFGEKLVEIIEYRTSVPYNYYSSIFLTRGLSGESFWVHRPYFEDKVSDIYKKWKSGYRGSILVTGSRHCGKSIFMEMLAREYFERRIVRISPESKLELDGRTLDTTNDLGTTLKFIEKSTTANKYLFIIDDLELWQTPNEPLGNSISALIRHLDKFATRNFYLIAMGKYAFEHYEKYYHLERSFQFVIDLSKTRPDILAEIIAKDTILHTSLYMMKKKMR